MSDNNIKNPDRNIRKLKPDLVFLFCISLPNYIHSFPENGLNINLLLNIERSE